jgi:uncharacterized membrane protein YgaE (UPF0421/DUF939 family)
MPIKIMILLEEDSHGRIQSQHGFIDEKDLQELKKMKSEGQEQVAYALLTEAVRREVLTSLHLLEKTNTPVPDDFKERLRKQLTITIDALLDGAIKEGRELQSL